MSYIAPYATPAKQLVICPLIAKKIGKSSALVLQQLHYWLSRNNDKLGKFEEGHQWIRNSYNQWQHQIQLMSLSTVRRSFAKLEALKIVKTRNISGNSYLAGGDQVKYFTIDYPVLDDLMGNAQEEHIGYSKKANSTASVKTTNVKHLKSHANVLQTLGKLSSDLLKMNNHAVQNEQAYITKPSTKKINNPSDVACAKAGQGAEQGAGCDSTATAEPTKTLLGMNDPTQTRREKIDEGMKNATQMLKIWNEIIQGEGTPVTLTPKRCRFLCTAFSQFFNQDIAQWEAFCLKIASSLFLMGEITSFKAHFDWAIQFTTINRILEGGYTFGDRIHKTPEIKAALKEQDAKESISVRSVRETIRTLIGDALYVSWFQDCAITEGGQGASTPVCASTAKKQTSPLQDMPCEQTLPQTLQKAKSPFVLKAPNTFVKNRLLTHFKDIIESAGCQIA